MRKFFKKEPRKYKVGIKKNIEIKDVGKIKLENNEQITFIGELGNRYDICRKEWGYYATPSVNSRLVNEQIKTGLVRNKAGQVYVMLVEYDKKEKFLQYCEEEEQELITWLDELYHLPEA